MGQKPCWQLCREPLSAFHVICSVVLCIRIASGAVPELVRFYSTVQPGAHRHSSPHRTLTARPGGIWTRMFGTALAQGKEAKRKTQLS